MYFDQLEVTISDQFKQLYPNRLLPKFLWIKPQGKLRLDDFTTATDGRLVVSSKALDVLRELGITHALVSEFTE